MFINNKYDKITVRIPEVQSLANGLVVFTDAKNMESLYVYFVDNTTDYLVNLYLNSICGIRNTAHELLGYIEGISDVIGHSSGSYVIPHNKIMAYEVFCSGFSDIRNDISEKLIYGYDRYLRLTYKKDCKIISIDYKNHNNDLTENLYNIISEN